MDQFNPQTIASLLITAVVLILAARGFIAYCNRVDAEWTAENPPPYPPELSDAGPVPPVSDRDKEIAAEHVAKILPASLRTPLPYVRKSELEDAVQAQMMADTLRGTKLP